MNKIELKKVNKEFEKLEKEFEKMYKKAQKERRKSGAVLDIPMLNSIYGSPPGNHQTNKSRIHYISI